MQITKHGFVIVVGIVLAVIFSATIASALPIFQPVQGGTGTSTIPTYGKMLMGWTDGKYILVSTSSLGISGGGGTPASPDTSVQFNDGGSFGGANILYNGNLLGIGIPAFGLADATTPVPFALYGGNATAGDNQGGGILILPGSGSGTNSGGDLQLGTNNFFGTGGDTGTGSQVLVEGGAGGATSGNGGRIRLRAGTAQGGNSAGGVVQLTGGGGFGLGGGGVVCVYGGVSGDEGTGGSLNLSANNGGATSGSGGSITLTAGSAQGGDSDGGAIQVLAGGASGAGVNGSAEFGSIDSDILLNGDVNLRPATSKNVKITNDSSGLNALIDTSLLTADRTIQPQDNSGVICLVGFACDGNGSWPFTPTTYNGQAAQSTTTLLWLRGSPLSLAASSSVITYASSTAITATTFFGALIGNASTATAFQTPRAINGVNFDGTAAITITAASSTLLADNNTFSGNNIFSSLLKMTTGFLSTASSTINGQVTMYNPVSTGNAVGDALAISTSSTQAAIRGVDMAVTNNSVGGSGAVAVALNAQASIGASATGPFSRTLTGGAAKNFYNATNNDNGFLVTQISGVASGVSITGVLSSTTDAAAFQALSPTVSSGDLLTDSYGLWVRGGSVSGTLTNRYGVMCDDQVGGTNRWCFYQVGATDNNYFAGKTGLGTTTPPSQLTILGDIGTDGAAPAVTLCGTGAAMTTGSTDTAGEVTEGTLATGCTITFAAAKARAPFCTASSEAGLAFSFTQSSSALTMTNIGALSSTKIDYICVQNNL